MNNRPVATLIILALMVLALIVCGRIYVLPAGWPLAAASPTFTTASLPGNNPAAAYAAAQATLAAGQSEMTELSRQATAVSLNIDQAANAAAQTTLEYHQQQLMELSIQSTEVSLNMARAAATQQSIAQQTQAVWNATASAQSQAATATYSAYILNVTQTAQAQANLDVQATNASQANALLLSNALTATPWAAIQADIVQTRKESERRAWWQDFVVTPVTAALVTGIVLLLIVGGVMAYRQLMPLLELRLRTISRDSDTPLLLVDGVIVDADAHHPQLALLQPPSDETPQVEIVGPSEPSVINWISEAEQKLHSEGWVQE